MRTVVAHQMRTSGHYGFPIVGNLIEPVPEAHWDDVLGLSMNMEYFYGSVRSEAGDYWWPIRGCYSDRARYLHLCESKIGGDFSYATDETNSYGGPIEHRHSGGRYEVVKPDGEALMAVTETTMEWRDGADLHITGERVGSGLQFYAVDADDPMLYTSRLFRAKGSIKGVPVSGLVFHDSMHTKDGRQFMQGPVITRLETAWVAFATEFEDGEIHSGHLIHGTEGFNVMIIDRSDGPPVIAHDVVVEAELDGPFDSESAFPQRITYTGAGETWVWEAAEGGRCPIRHDLIEGHRWRQGWVHHIDETRRPKATEALMETYNGRLVETGALREKAGR